MSNGSPQPFRGFRTEDPDELTLYVSGVAPGTRVVATGRDFCNRTFGWPLGRLMVFSYASWGGAAAFAAGRDIVNISVPLSSSFEVGAAAARRRVVPGEICIHAAAAEGRVWTRTPAHLMGVGVPTSLFDAHLAEGGREVRFPEPDTVVRTTTPGGRQLLQGLDRIRSELLDPESLLHTTRGGREAEAFLLGLLAGACAVDRPSGRLDDEAARRAEDLLAAHLVRPMSLAEVAAAADTSPRTLSRTVQRRHGVGPMAFRRRRRLEAVFRDLFVAEAEETSVTRVALQYGFTHFGRFAGDYRRAFGELPSQTLRR